VSEHAPGPDLLKQRDELLRALAQRVAKHDRPRGFDDDRWYAPELAVARNAIAKAEGGGK